MPEWFPGLLDEARRTLVDVRARQQDLQARHDEIEAAVAAATERLREVAGATAGDRDALAQAQQRAAEARRRVDGAQRLDGASWRERRGARRGFDDATQQHDRAADYLRGVETRTAPAVERYKDAVDAHRDLLRDRDHHQTVRQLDRLDRFAPNMAVAAMRVRALEVGGGWATGAPVTEHQLRVTRQALGQMPSTNQTRHLISELNTDPALDNPRPNRSRGVDYGVVSGGDVYRAPDRTDEMDLGRSRIATSDRGHRVYPPDTNRAGAPSPVDRYAISMPDLSARSQVQAADPQRARAIGHPTADDRCRIPPTHLPFP
jgi:hypothetical protein